MAKMSLANVTKGRIRRPAKVMVYGPEGVGKSTWGSCAPAPIFLGSLTGTDELDIARLPKPGTWPDALEGVHLLAREPHQYKSVVLDPIDWFEPLVYAHVLTKVSSLKDDFAAGYAMAREEWRLLMAGLDRLFVEKEMNIILLAHAEIKQFNNPNGADFDQWRVPMQDKTSAMFRQWVSDLLFATFETTTEKAGGGKNAKSKGQSSGKRIAYTEYRAGWQAKNRHGMPPQIPFTWEAFAEYLNTDIEASTKLIRDQIAKLAATLTDTTTRERIESFLKRTGVTIDELRSALSRAEQLVEEQEDKAHG